MTAAPSALCSDLYELTMANAYFELDMHETAVFELFVRRLPPERRFLIAAGLEQALSYLQELRFLPADIEFLAGLGMFSSRFLEHLGGLRFTGSVHAMAEGTPFYADEPVLRVSAPILEAQLVESQIINICHFQTLIASKAARCVLAAGGRRLVDFGMRRAHGADAALYAARAAYLGGFDATATIEAGRRFGIPLAGTMAHSFIQAHDSEQDAFGNFVMTVPKGTTLLVDTYDTERATARVIALARQLRAGGSGHFVQGVRIDSGDLARQARRVRSMLDDAGFGQVQIVLSGGLDEHSIDTMMRAGVPVDAFGVGTSLDTSADAPALDMAYKLESYAGKPRRKRSAGKATWPGIKQVWRVRDAGTMVRDCVTLEGQDAPGEALLHPVMRDGAPVGVRSALADARAYCARELAALPAAAKELGAGEYAFPVTMSRALRELTAALDRSDRAGSE